MRLRKFSNKLSDLITTAMLNPKDFGDVEVISALIGQAYMVNPVVAGGEFIVTVDKDNGCYTVEVPKPGHRAVIGAITAPIESIDSFRLAADTLVENGYERGVEHDAMMRAFAEQVLAIGRCHGWSEGVSIYAEGVGSDYSDRALLARGPRSLPADMPIPATESPVSDDSGVPGPETPAKLSSDPLDRAAVVLLIREKSKVARGRNLAEIANTLDALADEIAQHMEEQPIDVARALREFYVDCHARNVKAGWWNDLSNGEPKKRSVGELFMLFVTEIAEAYDAYVRGNIADDKLPQYPGLGVEIADLQIRLGDFAGALMAGSIVEHSGTFNPGDEMFKEVAAIAARYEAIRKTPEAKGATEMGEPLEPQDVAVMVLDKMAFNAQREDHKIENRMKEGGKQT